MCGTDFLGLSLLCQQRKLGVPAPRQGMVPDGFGRDVRLLRCLATPTLEAVNSKGECSLRLTRSTARRRLSFQQQLHAPEVQFQRRRPVLRRAGNITHIGPGYGSASSEGSEGDCARALIGTWRIGDLPQCIERCQSCAQCNFVSFAKQHRDCSWFAGCATKALGKLYGGNAYATFRVKPARGRTRCPGSPRTKVGALAAPRAVSAGTTQAVGVHLITFYSEGQPRDGGMPLGAMAGVLEAAFAPYVDSYRGYTPTGLYNRTLRWGEHPGVGGSQSGQVEQCVGDDELWPLGHRPARGQAVRHADQDARDPVEIPHGDLLPCCTRMPT